MNGILLHNRMKFVDSTDWRVRFQYTMHGGIYIDMENV